ncbi:type II toxin-antitoxin system prevent-host-death family antitoxin [Bosea sp. LjRoot9]|uniref:type II toxin-antitoxin system Phd/YefM family antitoxin n=1 Tax=Bosea sp. LjRoot9 TaxID=3342341 RepID=UPI003ECE120F
MITVGAFEAKTKFSELLDRVERGEEIVITRHGKAVARLVSQEPGVNPSGRDIRAEIMALRENLRAEGVSFSRGEIIALRDKGRR